jgi:hypothetical protein
MFNHVVIGLFLDYASEIVPRSSFDLPPVGAAGNMPDWSWPHRGTTVDDCCTMQKMQCPDGQCCTIFFIKNIFLPTCSVERIAMDKLSRDELPGTNYPGMSCQGQIVRGEIAARDKLPWTNFLHWTNCQDKLPGYKLGRTAREKLPSGTNCRGQIFRERTARDKYPRGRIVRDNYPGMNIQGKTARTGINCLGQSPGTNWMIYSTLQMSVFVLIPADFGNVRQEEVSVSEPPSASRDSPVSTLPNITMQHRSKSQLFDFHFILIVQCPEELASYVKEIWRIRMCHKSICYLFHTYFPKRTCSNEMDCQLRLDVLWR